MFETFAIAMFGMYAGVVLFVITSGIANKLRKKMRVPDSLNTLDAAVVATVAKRAELEEEVKDAAKAHAAQFCLNGGQLYDATGRHFYVGAQWGLRKNSARLEYVEGLLKQYSENLLATAVENERFRDSLKLNCGFSEDMIYKIGQGVQDE